MQLCFGAYFRAVETVLLLQMFLISLRQLVGIPSPPNLLSTLTSVLTDPSLHPHIAFQPSEA